MNTQCVHWARGVVLGVLCGLPWAASSGGETCRQVHREQVVPGWEEVGSVRVLEAAVLPQGAVDCRFYPDHGQRLNIRVPFETGRLRGADYQVFYTDGSAFIQGQPDRPLAGSEPTLHWQFFCPPETRDSKAQLHCTLRKGALSIHYSPGLPLRLEVGQNRLKGSRVMLRVDENRPLSAPADDGFSPEQTQLLMTQMRNGTRLDSRYHDLSQSAPSYSSTPLFGIDQALEVAGKVFAQLNRRFEK